MKTIFTFKTAKYFALSIAFIFFSVFLIAQTTHQVAVTSNVFTPKELTITAGDEVVWTNTQGNHNVNGTQTSYPSNPASFGNNVGSGWIFKNTFTIAGTYDYKCDPHVGIGMVGKITVIPKVVAPLKLTVNFTGMTPHVGQTMWLAVVDQSTKMEIARVKKTAAVAFSVEIPGIEVGKSYNVDFYSDHNKNGVYDAPPADHAWRMLLNNVTGNSTLNFAHNTSFTNIAWKNKLTIQFAGMTPHLGQKLTLFLKQSDTGVYKDTLVVASVPSAAFDMMTYDIVPGKSYMLDFYSDHNKNGVYDAPPTDHAWRIKLNNVVSDTLINFTHNTKFTDIFGPASYNVTVSNGKYTPANQTIMVGDTVIWTNIQGSHNVNGTQTTYPLNPAPFGNAVAAAGWTYKYVFNTYGTYDYQCDPHVAFGMVGKIFVNSKPSSGPFKLTVNFTGMTPHVGQTMWLAVIDQTSKKEVARVKKTAAVTFSVEIPGIEVGKSYNVDFYSDHNKNGVYDAPPADHAWRMQLNNVTGNSTLNFAHNTSFTNIAWKNKLTVHFVSMTPHLGQKLTLFLKQADTNIFKDTVKVNQIAEATFDVMSYNIVVGKSYKIDFYSDHNKNGAYNAPPTDHAWRIALDNVKGDTILNFTHNTSFTDIFNVTSALSFNDMAERIRLYPNPAQSYIELKLPKNGLPVGIVKVYSLTGALMELKDYSGNSESIRYDISHFNNGLYFMELNSGTKKEVLKFIKN